MMESFKKMSAQQKVLLIGGSFIVLLFLFKAITGSKSSSSGNTAVDTTNADMVSAITTSNKEQLAALAQQSADQMANLMDIFKAYQDENTVAQQSASEQSLAALQTLQDNNNNIILNLSAAQKASDEANAARMDLLISSNNQALSAINQQNAGTLDAITKLFSGYQSQTQAQLDSIKQESQQQTNSFLSALQSQQTTTNDALAGLLGKINNLPALNSYNYTPAASGNITTQPVSPTTTGTVTSYTAANSPLNNAAIAQAVQTAQQTNGVVAGTKLPAAPAGWVDPGWTKKP
jgi:hypothetical protein